jgi:hypothetical protein
VSGVINGRENFALAIIYIIAVLNTYLRTGTQNFIRVRSLQGTELNSLHLWEVVTNQIEEKY